MAPTAQQQTDPSENPPTESIRIVVTSELACNLHWFLNVSSDHSCSFCRIIDCGQYMLWCLIFFAIQRSFRLYITAFWPVQYRFSHMLSLRCNVSNRPCYISGNVWKFFFCRCTFLFLLLCSSIISWNTFFRELSVVVANWRFLDGFALYTRVFIIILLLEV